MIRSGSAGRRVVPELPKQAPAAQKSVQIDRRVVVAW